MENVLVLANPISLGRHGLTPEIITDALREAGVACEVEILADCPDYQAYRRRLGERGWELVVAAGGDGTLHHVANLAAELRVPMGILPLGTANDFARTLDIPRKVEAAVRVLVEGRRRRIDLGIINGRYFLNAAHMGLGVETAKLSVPWLKRVIGPAAYLVAAARAWRQARPVQMEVTTEKEVITVPAVQLLVGNGRFFGGGLQVAPEAALDEGLLDVHILEWPLSWLETLGWALALKRGTLSKQRSALHFRASRLTVRLAVPIDLNLDGEVVPMGDTLEFGVLAGGLEVIVP